MTTPGGIGAYDGHGFAPSLKQRHDARHGPLVRADAAAHKADSHTARDEHEEYDIQVAEAFAVKDIDAGQVAQERQHATDVYGIDMGQGFQHEAEDDAEDEDQQLDFTRLDGAISRQLCSMNVEKCAPETSVSRPFTI